MADIRNLWWNAGRMAFPVPQSTWQQSRWDESLRRVAGLLEPVWPSDYSAGPFTYSLGSLALLLYAGPYDRDLLRGVQEVPVSTIIGALGACEPQFRPEHVIRDGLTSRGHQLDTEDDQISALFRSLTVYHERFETQVELPSFEQSRAGTMMQWGNEWAHHALTAHYLAPH